MDSVRTILQRGVCCVLVSVAGAALADDDPRPLDATERVSVSFAMLATPTRGVTTRWMSMQQDLAAGQSMADTMQGQPFSFGVGGEPTGCGARLAIGPPEAQLAEHPVVWSAGARLLSASTDRLTLAVSWKRLVRDATGGPREVASEAVTQLELREGERVLLDLARAPSACLRNAALEVTASLKEAPALAAKQISYDVWLVHERKSGRRTSARTQLTAGQGQQLPFAFPAEKLPALASGGRADEKLQVTFTGKVRGRLRRDGALELSISSERMLSYVAPDGSNDGGIGDGGEKIVRVLSGEAIRIEIPPPARGPAGGDPRAPRMTQDLDGHTYALLVTVRPL